MRKQIILVATCLSACFAAQAGWVRTTCGTIVECDPVPFGNNFQEFMDELQRINMKECAWYAMPEYQAYPFPETSPSDHADGVGKGDNTDK